MDTKDSGWVSLHRKLLDWEWYGDANTFRLFVHCLLKANHTDKNWRGVVVKRGEFITSFDKLASELGLSKQNVRTSVKRLKSTHELTYKSTSQYTVMQVIKYNEYQEGNTRANKRATRNQHAANMQLTTTNNDNNKNNDNNDNKK